MSQVEKPGDEQADVLLDPNFDPGGGAMGTMGADGSVETNWFVLLHRRVTDRAVRSPRYQWWALVALLAGKPVPVEVTKPMGCATKWLEHKNEVVQLDQQWELLMVVNEV